MLNGREVSSKISSRVKKLLVSAQELDESSGRGGVSLSLFLQLLIGDSESTASQILRSAGLQEKDFTALSSEKAEAPSVKDLLEKAFFVAYDSGHSFVGTGHILLAVFSFPESAVGKLLAEHGLSRELVLEKLSARSQHKNSRASSTSSSGSAASVIERFDLDWTSRARQGTLGSVIDREGEIERLCQILLRRTKNNPLLVGEPGVGRASVVRGLARRIAVGEVAAPLLGKRVIAFGSNLLAHGPGLLANLLKETDRRSDVIIFIEDIHALFGPGGFVLGLSSPITGILQSRLDRGSLSLIGSTNPQDFSSFSSGDEPLFEYFQPVKVEEPSPEVALEIIRSQSRFYEDHHRVKFDEAALSQVIYLSHRFVTDKVLPEKALDIIDDTASLVRLRQGQPPTKLNRAWEELRKVREEKETLAAKGLLDEAEKARLRERRVAKRYEKLSKEVASDGERLAVTREDVAEVVSSQTGIPLSSLSDSESDRLLRMKEILKERIVGQDTAIDALARSLRRARTGLASPRRPIGVFLFLGPTGVGKTETAKALTEFLFGDEGKLLRLDMSDFMEKHNVARLVGAPPGYVGYFEGGELTEKIRQNPFSVILFDEVEKAHPDVLDILLQISEEGELKDARGRLADFKNTIVILTSNIGADLIRKERVGFSSGGRPASADYGDMRGRLLERLKKTLKPEFLNRLDDVVVFHSLSRPDLLKICDLCLSEIRERLKGKEMGIKVVRSARELLVDKGYSEEYGARPLRRTVEEMVANPISEMILRGEVAAGHVVQIGVKSGKLTFTSSTVEAPVS